MRRNRVVGLVLLGAFVLSGIGGAFWLTTGIEPEFELSAMPASVLSAPEPERDWSKTRALKVDAPTQSGDERPWVVRGIRLWEDTGTPCNEPLEIERCRLAQLNGKDPVCLEKERGRHPGEDPTFSQNQSNETGEFEIWGQGATVLFAGVQADVGLPRSLFGEEWRASLLPIRGGDIRYAILFCQPHAELRIDVVDEAGVESEGWRAEISGIRRPMGGPVDSEPFKRVPAGWPLWVHVEQMDVAGMWKQVILEREKLNSILFYRETTARTTLRGRVRSESTGEPLSPVRILAEMIGGPRGVKAQVLTDKDGRYSLELVPGTWRIQTSQLIDKSWGKVLVPAKVFSPGEWNIDMNLPRRARAGVRIPTRVLDPLIDLRPSCSGVLANSSISGMGVGSLYDELDQAINGPDGAYPILNECIGSDHPIVRYLNGFFVEAREPLKFECVETIRDRLSAQAA